ncbi:MAG: hypothetical protein AB8H79_15130 [Myxococcota bacterium]
MGRFCVIVNDYATLKPSQSTAELAAAIVGRGHQVWIAEASSASVFPDGSVHLAGVQLMESSVEASVARAQTVSPEPLPLSSMDITLVRTSPGRAADPAVHALLLDALDIHCARGGTVLSSPAGLRRAATKLYLAHLPEWTRPQTLVTQSEAALLAFVHERGRAVLKPLIGTQGRDVFLVETGDANLRAIAANLLRQGPTIAQSYVEQAPDGDVRLLLLDGECVEHNGEVAAVRRRPGAGEFRSNVHLGGTPIRANVGEDLKAIVREVGPILRADGLFMVGLDIVGDKIVEVNVFAPGGFQDAMRLAGVDFLSAVLDRLDGHICSR